MGDGSSNPASKMSMSSSPLRNISCLWWPLSQFVVERLWVVVEDRFSMTSRLVVCLNEGDESFKGPKMAHVDGEEVVAT